MIAIIIDHPARDLPPNILLAEELIKNKLTNKVIFVPLYYAKANLVLLEKYYNYLVLNYARSQNRELIYHLKKKFNKILIVNDTEQANTSSGKALSSKWKEDYKFLELIDLYLFWGKKQFNDCKKSVSKKFHPKKMTVTGWFNIDYIKKFKGLRNKNKKPEILINTNFPTIYPKFGDWRDVLNDTKNKKLYRQWHKSKNSTHKNLYFFLKNLFTKYPKERFRIRPHPFEDPQIWEKLSNDFANCSIDKNLNVLKSIDETKLLLHIDCTTGLEATLKNKPSISLKFLLSNKKHYQPMSDYYGYQAHSKNEFYKNFDYFVKFNKNKKFYTLKKKYIRNIYGPLDNKNCFRISKSIEKEITLTLKRNIINKISLFKKFQTLLVNLKINFLLKFKYKKTLKFKNFSVNNIKDYLDKKKFTVNKICSNTYEIKRI